MNTIQISIVVLFIFSFIQPLLAGEAEKAGVEVKFSIDTRMGLTKGLFRKSVLNVKDRKKRLGFVEIDVASIDTDNAKRDKHLRNEDFFEVDKFPKATFEILQMKETAKDTLQGKGRLSIKGIAKEYDFQAKLSSDGKIEKYSGSIKINRKDFGITYSSSINPIQDIAEVEFEVTMPMKKD